jgi:hypothetical protein
VQSKCRRTFHKSHFVREFTGKMPQTKTGDHTLCEPAQSKCTRTFDNLVVPSDPLAIYSRTHTCVYICNMHRLFVLCFCLCIYF